MQQREPVEALRASLANELTVLCDRWMLPAVERVRRLDTKGQPMKSPQAAVALLREVELDGVGIADVQNPDVRGRRDRSEREVARLRDHLADPENIGRPRPAEMATTVEWMTGLLGDSDLDDAGRRCDELLKWAEQYAANSYRSSDRESTIAMLLAVRLRFFDRTFLPRPGAPGGAHAATTVAELMASEVLGPNSTGVDVIPWSAFDQPGGFDDAVLAMMIELLQRAVDRGPERRTGHASPAGRRSSTADEIIVETPATVGANRLLRFEFEQAVHEALHAGWDVLHRIPIGLAGLDPQIEVQLLVLLLAHVQTDGVYRYELVDRLDADLVVAQGVGLVHRVGLARSVGQKNDETGHIAVRATEGRRTPAANKLVRTVFRDRRHAGARRRSARVADDGLVKRELDAGFRWPSDDLLWFDRHLTASELLEGDRHVLKHGFTTSTMPEELTRAQFAAWLAAETPLLSDDRAEEFARRVERLRQKRLVRSFAFDTNVRSHRYADIVPMSAVRAYVAEDEPQALGGGYVYGGMGLTVDQRRSHVRHLIAHLRETAKRDASAGQGAKVPGYRLAIAPDGALPIDPAATWWVLTHSDDRRADQLHFVHRSVDEADWSVAIWRRDASDAFEATVAFRALFDALWAATIPAELRSPDGVADWLEGLIE